MTIPPSSSGPSSPTPGHQMWGGRFGVGPTAALAALNDSLAFDRRLWPYDIAGSRAWAAALRGAGILSLNEEATILDGLDRVAERLQAGDAADATDEDIHTLVERLLYEEAGEVAGKLHTGRSRNDQVATDLRLWTRDALDEVDREVCGLGRALVGQARRGLDMLMPGYTHGQQAQPVRWGFVLLAHAWPLVRDRERVAAARSRVAALPLGSGALAGSTVAVDREALRVALRFEAVTANALDATGDRDFVAEVLFVATMIATHVSRLGGELVTYNSSEYGFIRLDDGYATGSSLLPQKRNPDVFELARAKAARTMAGLMGMLATMRALPAGYNKDLQEDKPYLFDAVDTLLTTLPAVRGAVETLEPNPERMRGALQDGLLATDFADGLVARGIPFRRAHAIIGELVRIAEEGGVSIRSLDRDRVAGVHPDLPAIMDDVGSFEVAVERRVTSGGTGRKSVEAQLDRLETLLAANA